MIAKAPGDLQSVLDTLLANAVKLSGATQGHIRQFDGEFLTYVSHFNESPEVVAALNQLPQRPRPESISTRALTEKQPVHILDAQTEPNFRGPAAQAHARTMLVAPLLREGVGIGTITIWRDFVEPFTDRQIELVKIFADQGVIAIENVRLFNEPEARNRDLTEAQAIERGLKYNLAGLLGSQGIRAAEGSRQLARSQLLPTISAGISESQAQINLKAYGFPTPPGVRYMYGPFSIFDGRFYLAQTIFDLKAINNIHAGSEQLKASQLSYKGIRDQVVLVCGQLYLRAVSGKSRIEAARVRVQTAQALHDLAVDRKQAGVAPAIDVLRAQVELQAQEQGLIVATNEFEKEKLDVARAIGLSLGQRFSLSDELRFSALPPMMLEDIVQEAYRDRSDYQSALAQLRAAQYARKAAEATKLPSLQGIANYGVNGPGPAESHGDYTIS